MVLPVLEVGKVCKRLEAHVEVRDYTLDMNLLTVGTLRTKTEGVVGANFTRLHMGGEKLAGSLILDTKPSLLAETSLKIRAVFAHSATPRACFRLRLSLIDAYGEIALNVPVTVGAFVALLTLLLPHIVSARRDAVWVIYMKKLALIVFLALVLEPVHTNRPFDLSLVSFLIL